MAQSYAKIRNVSAFAVTMHSACGDTVQINAGYHGNIESKFLHDYDGSAIVVLEHPPVPKAVTVKKVDEPLAPIDASVRVIDASKK